MPDVYEILDELGISFTRFDHPAVFTCEEAGQVRGDVSGVRIKNLFLRNKKGDKHFLLVAPVEKPIDLKFLSERIDEKKLGFASADRLYQYLGLTPGSVSPLGLINDEKEEVVVIIDSDLLGGPRLNFHPNVNTSTIQISPDDFLKFLESRGNKYLILEI